MGVEGWDGYVEREIVEEERGGWGRCNMCAAAWEADVGEVWIYDGRWAWAEVA